MKILDKLIKWWNIYKVNTLGVIGLVTFTIIVIMISIGPIIATHDPYDYNRDIGWEGGNYWHLGWTQSGSVSITSEGEPYADDPDDDVVEYHVSFTGDGDIKRMADLSNPSESSPHLQFYAKAVSFENGDEIRCLISPDGVDRTVVQTWVNGDDDGIYHLYDIDLSAYPNINSRTFTVEFEAEMASSDAVFYLDSVKIPLSAPGMAVQSPYDNFEPYITAWAPPSRKHLLGTNSDGQDMFSRLLHSGQISLLLGVVASSSVSIIGTTVGLLAGFYGGLFDEVIQRIVDVLSTLPGLPLLIIMATLLGQGINTILFVIIVTGWTKPVRRMRIMTHSMKYSDYVDAERLMGASVWRIVFRHMLPNVGGLFAVSITSGITGIIMLEASLSYLGFGDPFRLSLGKLLQEARSAGAFTLGAWWSWVPAGLLLTAIGLSCIFIGNAINERFVLRLRRRRGMV